MKKTFAVLFTLIVMILSITCACAEESVTISFESDNYSVPVGKNITLKAIISPRKNMKLEWSSSNEEVATVSKNGAVKGLSEGDVVITVRSADNSDLCASCKVSVVVPVKKITLSDKAVTLAAGLAWRLKATVEPEDATNKNLVWSSSNEKVAMVSDEGVITGLTKGSAKITASATDGSNSKAAINVKVDEYHVVFTTPFTQQTAYQFKFVGHISIRGKVKKGNVSISDVDRDIGGGGNGYLTDHFNVTPLKAGTDVVTLRAGNSINYNIYIHPDTFRFQDLGFGQGAVIHPGEQGVFEGHTYQIFKDKCPWAEAREKCEQAGGHLVTITSPEEQQYIDLLNYENHTLWIGLYEHSTDNWEWITGEEMVYTHWDNGEPNDYGTREYQFENVGAIRPAWNDYHENNTADIYGYICEWDDIVVDVEAVEEEGTVIGSDWIGTNNGHTYEIFDEICTWKEAKEKCEALGGHLVTITAPDEYRFLQRLNKSNKWLWIGLRIDSDDNWKWITGEDLAITIWNDGEPNNTWSREYPYENVVLMTPGWNDTHEENLNGVGGFICEWDYLLDNIDEVTEEAGIIEKEGKLGIYRDHKYQIVTEQISWQQAKEKCEAAGGHLVSISSENEQRFLNRLNKDNKMLWIGFHREGSSDSWYWVTDEEINYSNWADGQPDNYANVEEAAGLWPIQWNDFPDSTRDIAGYICEWDDAESYQQIAEQMNAAPEESDWPASWPDAFDW